MMCAVDTMNSRPYLAGHLAKEGVCMELAGMLNISLYGGPKHLDRIIHRDFRFRRQIWVDHVVFRDPIS